MKVVSVLFGLMNYSQLIWIREPSMCFQADPEARPAVGTDVVTHGRYMAPLTRYLSWDV